MQDTSLNRSILIRHILYPITVLGPGKRIGIWFQGCSIQCEGCMAKYTWPFDQKYNCSILSVLNKIKPHLADHPDGVVISGGEPFDQPDSLFFLIKAIKEKFNIDILVYSGYSYDYLKNQWANIIYYIDILICDPLQFGVGHKKKWRGSDNQRIIIFTEEILQKYFSDFVNDDQISSIQLFVDNNSFILVGIPQYSDLKKLSLLSH